MDKKKIEANYKSKNLNVISENFKTNQELDIIMAKTGFLYPESLFQCLATLPILTDSGKERKLPRKTKKTKITELQLWGEKRRSA